MVACSRRIFSMLCSVLVPFLEVILVCRVQHLTLKLPINMQRDLNDVLIDMREKLALCNANQSSNWRQLLCQRLAYCFVFLAFYLSRFTSSVPIAVEPDFDVNFLILNWSFIGGLHNGDFLRSIFRRHETTHHRLPHPLSRVSSSLCWLWWCYLWSLSCWLSLWSVLSCFGPGWPRVEWIEAVSWVISNCVNGLARRWLSRIVRVYF